MANKPASKPTPGSPLLTAEAALEDGEDGAAEVAEATTDVATDATLNDRTKRQHVIAMWVQDVRKARLTYLDLALLAALVADARTLETDWSTDSTMPLALDLHRIVQCSHCRPACYQHHTPAHY